MPDSDIDVRGNTTGERWPQICFEMYFTEPSKGFKPFEG